MQFHPKDLSDLDELTEEHLGFSALSDGLGFSQTKNKVQSKINPSLEEEELALKKPASAQKTAYSGTGAVAAGLARPAPAMFQTPKTAASAISSPVMQPAAPRWIRCSAFFVDAMIVLLPLAYAWWFSFGDDSIELIKQDIKSPIFLAALIFSMYFLLSESFGGQSLGKMLFGLHVVEDDKYQKPIGFRYALPRAALFLIGTALFGIGLLASFIDSKKRPWHDRYSGSIVRKKV